MRPLSKVESGYYGLCGVTSHSTPRTPTPSAGNRKQRISCDGTGSPGRSHLTDGWTVPQCAGMTSQATIKCRVPLAGVVPACCFCPFAERQTYHQTVEVATVQPLPMKP